ncbi:MAG: hypothetical protein Q9195_006158 [Heterodermia aff. obscurata]
MLARRLPSTTAASYLKISQRTSRRQLSLAFIKYNPVQSNNEEHQALARDLGRSVYALDLRNHGESPHDIVHNYLSMADDVEEFIQNHGLNRVILIGHSMTLALRSPNLVEAVIPVDNAPVDATLKSDFIRYIQGLRSINDAAVTKQIDADGILQKYEKSLAIRQFLLSNLIRSANGKTLKLRIPIKILGGSLDDLGDFPYRDPEEARYDGPTLFIRGTKSHYVADEVLPVIGRFFPRFELQDIDCGHWIISEKPEPFRRAVVEFVKRHDGGR